MDGKLQRAMKILLCTINFAPELTGVGKYSGDMAEWLCERGHEIRVVTAPPHYPQWKIASEYPRWRFQKERHPIGTAGAVEVLRCPLWVPRVPRGWKRVVHLLSFAVSSWPAMLRSVAWRPDIVLLVAPTFVCAPQALVVSRLSGAIAWLHTQDFELDAAFGLNDFSSGKLRGVAEKIESLLIRRFDRGSSITGRMLQRLMDKGLRSSAGVFFPNWVDTSVIYPMSRPIPLRDELGVSEDKTLALYSGSMGKKQGMEFLLKVCERLAGRSDIHFVFCGEGPNRESLGRIASSLPNVTWLPLQPLSRLNELLNIADIHLLPQVAGAADLVMPSKMGGMMASGKAILATAKQGTELYDVLATRGMLVPPGDLDAFVRAMIVLAEDSVQRSQLGQRGRAYATANYERSIVLERFELAMMEACGSRSKVDKAHVRSVSEIGRDYVCESNRVGEK